MTRTRPDKELQALLALDLEYRLTIAVRTATDDCSCPEYLVARRTVLLPAIIDAAEQAKADPVDWFAGFARRLHATRCEATDG